MDYLIINKASMEVIEVDDLKYAAKIIDKPEADIREGLRLKCRYDGNECIIIIKDPE